MDQNTSNTTPGRGSAMRLVVSVACGTILGVFLVLASLIISGYPYSKYVVFGLRLLPWLGAVVVSMEVERIAGDSWRRSIEWTAALVCIILFFLLSIATQSLAVVYVLSVLVAYRVGIALVGRARLSGTMTHWRRTGRKAAIIILLILACVEYGARSIAFASLKSQALGTLPRYGLALPAHARWTADYYNAADPSLFPSLSLLLANQPSCAIHVIGQRCEIILQHLHGSTPTRIRINGTIPARAPGTPQQARNALRRCPALKKFPLENWEGPLDNHDGEWAMRYASPVDKNGQPIAPKDRYPYYPPSSQMIANTNGYLLVILDIREK